MASVAVCGWLIALAKALGIILLAVGILLLSAFDLMLYTFKYSSVPFSLPDWDFLDIMLWLYLMPRVLLLPSLITAIILLVRLRSGSLKTLSAVLLALWAIYFWLWNFIILEDRVPGGEECVELVCESPALVYELMILIYPLANVLVPIVPYIMDKTDKYKQAAIVLLLWSTVALLVKYMYTMIHIWDWDIERYSSTKEKWGLEGYSEVSGFFIDVFVAFSAFPFKGFVFWLVLNTVLVVWYLRRLRQSGNERLFYITLFVCCIFLYIYVFGFSEWTGPLWMTGAIFASAGVLWAVSWVRARYDNGGAGI